MRKENIFAIEKFDQADNQLETFSDKEIQSLYLSALRKYKRRSRDAHHLDPCYASFCKSYLNDDNLLSDPSCFNKSDILQMETDVSLRISELHPFKLDVLLLGGGRNKRQTKGRQPRKRGPTATTKSIEGSMGATRLLGSFKIMQLVYTDADSQRTGGASNYFAFDYRINDCYDPDPLFLTGGITGFAETSAFFSRWIVEEFELNLTLTNQENFPLTAGVVFSPVRLSTFLSTRALAIDALERWGAVTPQSLGHATGQDRCRFPLLRVKPGHVLGNPSLYMGEEAFSGFSTASPLSQLYVTIIVFGPATVSTPNGVFCNAVLRYKTRFFSIQSSLLGMSRLITHYDSLMISEKPAPSTIAQRRLVPQ
jgi:hypothetical protein